MNSEIEDAYDEEEEGEEEPGFAIGTVIFPIEKEKDFIDTNAVLINHVDTFIGKHLAIYLSNKKVGAKRHQEDDGEEGGEEEEEEDFINEDETESVATGRGDPCKSSKSKYWKLLGTLKDQKSPDPPFLWATVLYDDFDAYIKEVLKCGVIIYDITEDASPERLNEIRRVCDALREKVTTFSMKRVFILISSLHSWSHTTRPQNDPEFMLSEIDYRRRRTKPAYRELQLLERYVVASGKMTKGMLKAYVIGAGAVYGEEESPLHHWFKSAWYNAKNLPIYGTGNNIMPTIYIKDLANIVQNVMDLTPKKQRYIIAVDPVLCQQDQIIKAISKTMGTGKVKMAKENEIYLNRELEPFQADQLLLDLPIQTTFCQDNFDIDWTAEKGLASIMRKIVNEFKKARNLTPLKLVLVGPPGVGKSTVARQLSDMYRLHHFSKQDMIESAIKILRDVAGDVPSEEDKETDEEAERLTFAQNLLAEVDESMSSQGQLSDDIIIKLYRYRLKRNDVQNQGFVLDGFPETYAQAKALFVLSQKNENDEDVGEDDDRDFLDPQLSPDRVVFLEAPDDFLIKRLLKVPIEQLEERHFEPNFPFLLQDYNDQQTDYEKTFVAYLNDQEILYEPIDVSEDTSDMMQATTIKISHLLGRPRNYGLTLEEEIAIENSQRCEKAELKRRLREDMDLMKTRLLESRRKNIEEWMEKLERSKREEFEREESAMIPLRHYLMTHVVPTLTKGLIDITRVRPDDPVDYLAEFLFQNNSGGVNPCGEKPFF